MRHRAHDGRPDAGEDIQVEVLDAAQVLERIAAGEIRHSLVLSALARVYDLRPAFRSPR